VRSVELGLQNLADLIDSRLQARVCVAYDSGAPAAGVEVAATAHGPAVVSVERLTADTDARGCVIISWKIGQYGKYRVQVERLFLQGVPYYAGGNKVSGGSMTLESNTPPIIPTP
jgi:hypothetical protein